jgi:hypothetical protein
VNGRKYLSQQQQQERLEKLEKQGSQRKGGQVQGQTTVTEATPQKIVVTTTIRLDGEEGGPADIGTEALQALAASGGAESVSLQKMISEGRMVMMRIAPRTYLGLTHGRRRIQPLRIDDHLFIFAPRQDSLRSLADLISDLMRTHGHEAADRPLARLNFEEADTDLEA